MCGRAQTSNYQIQRAIKGSLKKIKTKVYSSIKISYLCEHFQKAVLWAGSAEVFLEVLVV